MIYNDITAEHWYEHFLKVFGSTVASDAISQEDEFTNADTAEEIHEVFFNEAISEQGVIVSISDLKAGKSTGPDKTQREMLKHANEVVIDISG